MLDIQFIRENAQAVQQVARQKGIDVDVDRLLELDHRRLELLQKVETLRHQRNKNSETIATLLKEGKQEEAEHWKDVTRKSNLELQVCETQLADIKKHHLELMLRIPNLVSPDTPVGESDEDNVEIRQVGCLPHFEFAIRDHVSLAENLGMLDTTRGVKVAGSRGYFLKDAGLHLHRAVQQLCIDLLVERGFTVMDVPALTREEALLNTGFFPTGRDQSYHLEADEKWLVGTSEVPLVSYHAEEIVDVEQPIRMAAVSNCFRKEAGSAGRDVHGLYRVHQFSKVEQVVICRNDLQTSLSIFDQLLRNAEDILDLLELPYRVVSVCTGDLAQKNYKQYDIETWMPSREGYGETHSCSILLDFQARRSKIRYRDENRELQFCHTLNNTAIASPRILIPLLENHQREDGSVYIPEAIRKYMYGMTELHP